MSDTQHEKPSIMGDTETSMDDDVGMILDEGWRAARKPHLCWECSRQIDKSERHYHMAILAYRCVTSWHTCNHCYYETDA